MNRERPQYNEIQPMSPRRKWVVRAGAEAIAAVGLGFVLASGYEAVADQDLNVASPLLVSALGTEVGAGVVILKQLTAEKKNKEYLKIQRLLNQGKGLQAASYYHLGERREILTRMGLIEPQEERPDAIDIPNVFRNAFNDDLDDTPREIE